MTRRRTILRGRVCSVSRAHRTAVLLSQVLRYVYSVQVHSATVVLVLPSPSPSNMLSFTLEKLRISATAAVRKHT